MNKKPSRVTYRNWGLRKKNCINWKTVVKTILQIG